MKRKLIVGEGRALEQAYVTAREDGLDCLLVELHAPDRYNFDLSPLLKQYAISETQVFVALDERAVNFTRHKLIAEVRLAGYELLNIVSSRSFVDETVRLSGNVYIAPGCSLAAGSNIGLGCWLDRQVFIDEGVVLGACVTLNFGVQLGRDVDIGRGSTLGSGSRALCGTKVGRGCEWLLPMTLLEVLPDRSFYDQLMPSGARIL